MRIDTTTGADTIQTSTVVPIVYRNPYIDAVKQAESRARKQANQHYGAHQRLPDREITLHTDLVATADEVASSCMLMRLTMLQSSDFDNAMAQHMGDAGNAYPDLLDGISYARAALTQAMVPRCNPDAIEINVDDADYARRLRAGRDRVRRVARGGRVFVGAHAAAARSGPGAAHPHAPGATGARQADAAHRPGDAGRLLHGRLGAAGDRGETG